MTPNDQLEYSRCAQKLSQAIRHAQTYHGARSLSGQPLQAEIADAVSLMKEAQECLAQADVSENFTPEPDTPAA